MPHIEARRERSAADLAIAAEARMYQRRLRTTHRLRKAPLLKLDRSLSRHRKMGFPSDVAWWLCKYNAIAEGELRNAANRRSKAIMYRGRAY